MITSPICNGVSQRAVYIGNVVYHDEFWFFRCIWRKLEVCNCQKPYIREGVKSVPVSEPRGATWKNTPAGPKRNLGSGTNAGPPAGQEPKKVKSTLR